MRPRLLALVLAFAAPAFAEEGDVASSLPGDIPGGPDQAAKAVKSGVPQLVKKTLEDLAFAQEVPAFEPWRVALEGRASKAAREAWSLYLTTLVEKEIEGTEFRKQATAWFEAHTELAPEESAELSYRLRTTSEVLAKRHEPPAHEGFLPALMSLAGNSAGHAALLEMCKADLPEERKVVIQMAASYTQSLLFRSLFEEWSKSPSVQVAFLGTNGILRLGDPADVKIASAYFSTPRAIRRFEVYRSLSWIKSKEVVDLLVAEQPHCQDLNREAVVIALSRQRDERVLPLLRKLRDAEGYTRGVCAGLWRVGRAGDVAWLKSKMDDGEMEAAVTLRHLLGKACPIEFSERSAAVQKWIEEHKEAIEKDEELVKR
jgi:hypothetical protein